MKPIIVAYFTSVVVFLGLDMVWLLLIARDFYKSQMGSLMADKPQIVPAVAFYLLFVVGVVIFGISPALRDQSWRTALVSSALFGFFCYATYDLTNLAVVRGWPMPLTLVDLAWGTVLAGVVGTCGYFAASAVA